MRSFKNRDARRVLFFWGVMDAIFVAIYVQGRLRRDEIPYVTDVLDSVQVIKDFDGFVVVLAVLGALLHISIVVSSILLISGRRMGVYLGLLQIPFRLFYMLPSLSLLLMVAAYVPNPASWFLVACVVFSESAKTYSLWRILKCSRVGRVSSGAA